MPGEGPALGVTPPMTDQCLRENLNGRSRACTQAQTLDPYILTNANGLEAHILPYGAIVQKLLVPDSSGVLRDLVLGFDKLAPYEVSCTLDHHTCFR